MARTARNIVDGGLYHLINRGNGQQVIFHKDEDFQAFVCLLQQMGQNYNVEILAWCLMSNHYHLVVKPEKAEQLSQGMHWFKSTHVRRYHKHYGSSGHLWQRRYKSFSIDSDEQLLTVIRYIEANPVRANMVDTAAGWIWSSHSERCALLGTGSEGACPPFLVTGSILAPLPIELPQPWAEYVDTPMTDQEIYRMRNHNR